MAGIYIHVPYCRQKCHYCNFFSGVSLKSKSDVLSALHLEMELRKDYLEGEQIRTIYFGGGTPSILEVSEIKAILDKIFSLFKVVENAEITLEANPDDLTEEKLNQLKSETVINRLSIGIQSFFDEDLRYLNRSHDGGQARQAVKNAAKAGFLNLTLDFIFGMPTLNEKNYLENLNIAIELGATHLSCYQLTVEPKTALDAFIQKGKVVPPPENEGIKHFYAGIKYLISKGFSHYEISNFAKSGFEAMHNTAYWKGEKYLGLGPSAHSYNGISRSWNILSTTEYIQSLESGIVNCETEFLSEQDHYNEYILTAIRTSKGVDSKVIAVRFGKNTAIEFENSILPFLVNKKVVKNDSVYTLSNEGLIWADKIASELFLID